MCQWIELAIQHPPIKTDWYQTDNILVAYHDQSDLGMTIAFAFFDSYGKGGSWIEVGTFQPLPIPRYWMPIPEVPKVLNRTNTMPVIRENGIAPCSCTQSVAS